MIQFGNSERGAQSANHSINFGTSEHRAQITNHLIQFGTSERRAQIANHLVQFGTSERRARIIWFSSGLQSACERSGHISFRVRALAQYAQRRSLSPKCPFGNLLIPESRASSPDSRRFSIVSDLPRIVGIWTRTCLGLGHRTRQMFKLVSTESSNICFFFSFKTKPLIWLACSANG